MNKKIVYKVVFQAHNQVYELYALSVTESEMFGFVEIEDIVFGESSQVVIDPNDEKLRTEFAGVRRTYIPLHQILRIDSLEKEGIARIHPTGEHSNVRVLPTGIMRKHETNKEQP